MHLTIVDDIQENLELYNDLLLPQFDVKLIQDPGNVEAFLKQTD